MILCILCSIQCILKSAEIVRAIWYYSQNIYRLITLSFLLPGCCTLPACITLCVLCTFANHVCLFEIWLTALIGRLRNPPHEFNGVGCVKFRPLWLTAALSISTSALVCETVCMCSNTLWQWLTPTLPLSVHLTQKRTENKTCYVMGSLLWKCWIKGNRRGSTKKRKMQAGSIKINLPGLLCKGK